MAPDAVIAVWRHSRNRGAHDGLSGAETVVYDVEAALEFKPDVALITNPASFHIAAASALAERDIHLFIEKPISNALLGVPALIARCRQRNLVLMVGYPLRFNRPLQVARQAILDGAIGRLVSIRAEVGSYLPDWRPEGDYREQVSASHTLGGGAVLELSHELDYVRWIGGEVKSVSALLGRIGGLEMEVEDTAEITLQMTNGSMANIHLDMIQRATTRTCRFIGREGTLLWDGVTGSVRLYSAGTREWSILHAPDIFDRNTMYIDELQCFLRSAADKTAPVVTGEDGLRVLEIALAAKRSHEEQRVITLEQPIASVA
jgi:predicted dehydrogenase